MREDNKKLNKFEYETIIKYISFYINKYKEVSSPLDSEYYNDVIFSQCLNKYLSLKNSKITNEKMIAKYISLLVKGVVINFCKNKSNDLHNELNDKNIENPLNKEEKEDDITNGIYVNKTSDIDSSIFYESLISVYTNLDEKEKLLFSYLEENTDSYKWSVSRICKELNITRYDYVKCIKKIQDLCKKYL